MPKLVITDIDGVWTDGGMYYDQIGNEFKRFNTSDSVGVYFCKQLNIPIAIMTGETTEIVARRAKKLNIDYLMQGVKNKLECARDLCHHLNITLDDVAFIGDDINDLELLRSVGFSACTPASRDYIKREVDYITMIEGGYGAFRDMIEYVLGEKLITKLVENYSKHNQ